MRRKGVDRSVRPRSTEEDGSRIVQRPIDEVGFAGAERPLERYSHKGINLGVRVGAHL